MNCCFKTSVSARPAKSDMVWGMDTLKGMVNGQNRQAAGFRDNQTRKGSGLTQSTNQYEKSSSTQQHVKAPEKKKSQRKGAAVDAIPIVHVNYEDSSAVLYTNPSDSSLEESTDTKKNKEKLQKINEIMENCKEFEQKIDEFLDDHQSDRFFSIDEKLQRNIEKLDRIDINGSELLKAEIKKVIKYIYVLIEKLEIKAKAFEETKFKEEEARIKKLVEEVIRKYEEYHTELKSVSYIERIKQIYLDLESDITKLQSIDMKNRENLEKYTQECGRYIHWAVRQLINNWQAIENMTKPAATETTNDNSELTARCIEEAVALPQNSILRECDIRLLLLSKIYGIIKQCKALRKQVELFLDVPGSKKYNYCSRIIQEYWKELNDIETRESKLLIHEKNFANEYISSTMNILIHKANKNVDGKTRAVQVTAAVLAHKQSAETGNKAVIEKSVDDMVSMKQVDEILKEAVLLDYRISSYWESIAIEELQCIRENLQRNIEKLDSVDTRENQVEQEKVKYVMDNVHSLIKKIIVLENINKCIKKTTEYEQMVEISFDVVRNKHIYSDLQHEIEKLNDIYQINKDTLGEQIKQCLDYIQNVMQRIIVLDSIHNILQQCNKMEDQIKSFSDKSSSQEYYNAATNFYSLLVELKSTDIGDSQLLANEKEKGIRFIEHAIEKLVETTRENNNMVLYTQSRIEKTVDDQVSKEKQVTEADVPSTHMERREQRNNIIRILTTIENIFTEVQKIEEKIETSDYGEIRHYNETFHGYINKLNAIDVNGSNYLREEVNREHNYVASVLEKLIQKAKTSVPATRVPTEKTNIAVDSQCDEDTQNERTEISTWSLYFGKTMQKISTIMDNATKLNENVQAFLGDVGNDEYNYITKGLQDNLKYLNNIAARDNLVVKCKIKDVTDYIHVVINNLAEKAKENQNRRLSKEPRLPRDASAQEYVSGSGQKYEEEIKVTNGAQSASISKRSVESKFATQDDNKIIRQISDIMKNTNDLNMKIDSFLDSADSDGFLYIDSDLQGNILKLMSIQVDNPSLKEKINEFVIYINDVRRRLQWKAEENRRLKKSREENSS